MRFLNPDEIFDERRATGKCRRQKEVDGGRIEREIQSGIRSPKSGPNLQPIRLAICVYLLVMFGCGDPDNPMLTVHEILELGELSITDSTLDTGGAATVTAQFSYTGSASDLIFRWTAEAGTVIGETASVTYLAPDAPGVYTITLELTDGLEIAQGSVSVEVFGHSLSVASDTHWPENELTSRLKYRINVTEIFRPDVVFRYEILQDRATTGGFLSISVNSTLFVNEAAIGEVGPGDKPVITGEVDVSSVVTQPGSYELTLTLLVTKPVDRGWLLQEAELIGAEGAANQL